MKKRNKIKIGKLQNNELCRNNFIFIKILLSNILLFLDHIKKNQNTEFL